MQYYLRLAVFSLPTQRCFRYTEAYCRRLLLFSAYAEVFPAPSWPPGPESSFLCLRRGVSGSDQYAAVASSFSLPTQRCFRPMKTPSARRLLFSAYAEVFLGQSMRGKTPDPFLCLRRGVSGYLSAITLHLTFSLPTQRCFLMTSKDRGIGYLFSAYAEVFLGRASCRKASCPFLCLRRGVSS